MRTIFLCKFLAAVLFDFVINGLVIRNCLFKAYLELSYLECSDFPIY